MYTLSTASTYNSATTVFNPQTFSVPLTRTEPSSAYHFGHSIHEIDYYLVGQVLNLTVFLGSKAATSVTFNLHATNANKLKVLKVGYAIIEPVFEVYTFSYHWMSPSLTMTNGLFHQ